MSLWSIIRVKTLPSCWSGQNEDICPSIKKSMHKATSTKLALLHIELLLLPCAISRKWGFPYFTGRGPFSIDIGEKLHINEYMHCTDSESHKLANLMLFFISVWKKPKIGIELALFEGRARLLALGMLPLAFRDQFFQNVDLTLKDPGFLVS